MSDQNFFTFSEYMRKDQDSLSPSAQDYMEMIYRLSQQNGFTRVNDLAAALRVQPPSVTKMVQKLSEQKLIKYEKYGVIMLEPEGVSVGKTLLERHNFIESFLTFLGVSQNLLEQTEKIEHTLNEEVLQGMKDLMEYFSNHPCELKKFNQFRQTQKQSRNN